MPFSVASDTGATLALEAHPRALVGMVSALCSFLQSWNHTTSSQRTSAFSALPLVWMAAALCSWTFHCSPGSLTLGVRAGQPQQQWLPRMASVTACLRLGHSSTSVFMFPVRPLTLKLLSGRTSPLNAAKSSYHLYGFCGSKVRWNVEVWKHVECIRCHFILNYTIQILTLNIYTEY